MIWIWKVCALRDIWKKSRKAVVILRAFSSVQLEFDMNEPLIYSVGKGYLGLQGSRWMKLRRRDSRFPKHHRSHFLDILKMAMLDLLRKEAFAKFRFLYLFIFQNQSSHCYEYKTLISYHTIMSMKMLSKILETATGYFHVQILQSRERHFTTLK